LGSSRRSVLLAAALVVAAGAASPPLCAQGPQAPLVLSGRAVRVRGRDTTALSGAVVVAHRIGLREQGPLDSLKADARGAFRFRIARPDTGVMYVVSTRYAGIGYFSEPFSVRDHAGADTIRLAVYDTAATGSPLVVAVRHLVISAPGGDGSRDALDIVQVGNGGETTRVPRDSTSPTWHMKLPRGIESFRVGEGDVPNSAVVLAADSILVSAPFPPGLKQVVVTYAVPRDLKTLRVPIDQPTQRLELLVEDSTAEATGPALVTADPLTIQGRRFRRFSATGMGAGGTVAISFGGTRARDLGWLAVVLSAVLLGAGGWIAAQRRRTVVPVAPVREPDQDALLRQIVALDERYAAGAAGTPPAEWAAYEAKRAQLKARLAERLARR
jgi:hypothetical protein